jgi:hypothetical protein
MHKFIYLMCLIVVISLVSCADLETVGRQTVLPLSKNETIPTGKDGVAIHLDAQQRLVMFHLNKYCAEPSPDALAAYASSLGLGASDATKNAASLALGLQSSAGSIGLRTQSITLMRDALYRMCEAQSNGSLSNLEVAKLLHQSQDLTAVILAVEQLTGAVTANQVVLGGTTSSSSISSLVSNQQALDAARKGEAAKKVEMDNAIQEQQSAMQSVAKKEIELKVEQGKLDGLADDASQTTKNAATIARDTKQVEVDLAKNLLTTASEQLIMKRKLYTDAVALTLQVEAQKDSAMASANAATSMNGQFSPYEQHSILSKEATESIAKSVQAMVSQVLTKDYSSDACMSYLTQPQSISGTENEREFRKNLSEFCMSLVLETTRIAQNQLSEQRQRLEFKYEADGNTDVISKCLSEDPKKKGVLITWLKSHSIDEGITEFLVQGKYKIDRKLFLDSGSCTKK